MIDVITRLKTTCVVSDKWRKTDPRESKKEGGVVVPSVRDIGTRGFEVCECSRRWVPLSRVCTLHVVRSVARCDAALVLYLSLQNAPVKMSLDGGTATVSFPDCIFKQLEPPNHRPVRHRTFFWYTSMVNTHMPARRKSPRRSPRRSKGSRSNSSRRSRRSSGKARRSPKRRTYKGVDARLYGSEIKSLPAAAMLPPPDAFGNRRQTFGNPLMDKHVSELAPPIERTATLDEYMKNLAKFTFNEPHFMENMPEDTKWLTVPEYVYGREEQHIIIKSRFSTYCSTVLQPLIEYLMNAQFRWDSESGRVAVMHGGEYGIREEQKCISDILLPPQERGKAKCLRGITKHPNCTLNNLFSLTAGTEVEGRIKVNEKVVENGEYPVKRKLTILGHTPMTLAIPCTDEDKNGNRVIHMDTQTNDRSKCSSCVAWNDDGEFIVRFSLPVPQCDGQILTHFHKPIVFNTSGIANAKTKTMIFHATSNDLFRRDNVTNMKFAGRSDDGLELFVKATVPNSFDSSVNVYELRKTNNSSVFPTNLTHAAWGDVEGNLTFLNGCKKHLEALREHFTGPPKIVCLGDVVGPATLGRSIGDTIDEAACIAWANTTDVKLIGNRDFNKLRLVPEYVFWKTMERKPTIDEVKSREAFLNTTFPLKHDGTWLHKKGEVPDDSIAHKRQHSSITL